MCVGAVSGVCNGAVREGALCEGFVSDGAAHEGAVKNGECEDVCEVLRVSVQLMKVLYM